MGIPLKRSEKVEYLGVIFDQKMQWEDHIKNVNQKTLFKYSKIKAIASSLTPHTKKLLINALVMPYLNYAPQHGLVLPKVDWGSLRKG